MTSTSTDPADIEADLDRDRAELATTLDALSDRVSVDNLARQALGAFKSRAGGATSTIDTAVRTNPLAVALIGAGVAWLLIGNRARSGGASGTSSSRAPYAGPEHDDLSGEGRTSTLYGSAGYQAATSEDDDHSWSREAHGLRARAAAALRRIESEAKSYYASLTGGGSGGEGARDYESERQSVISSFTNDLKARFSHGLDGLSDASRDRIVAARERAYAASLKTQQMGRSAMSDPGRMMEEHPLVAGAVAFALGAAAGAALPGTEAEDRAFGADRDRLMDEAARLLRSERERAMQIAGSLGQEIKAAAQETIGAAADKAAEAAGRVTDRAAEEVQASRPSSGTGSGGTAGPGDPVIG